MADEKAEQPDQSGGSDQSLDSNSVKSPLGTQGRPLPSPSESSISQALPGKKQSRRIRRSQTEMMSVEGLKFASELTELCRNSSTSPTASEQRLAELSTQVLKEAQDLRRRLRKQAFDFHTLLEIISQASARSLNSDAMQTYILRTISGHFATPGIMILRRQTNVDNQLIYSASQGIRNSSLTINPQSLICQELMSQRHCLLLEELSSEVEKSPEVKTLQDMKFKVAVPMIQEIETAEPHLEGVLLLGETLSKRPYKDPDLEFLSVLGKMAAICFHNESLYQRSIIDDLTGVASRGHFDVRLMQEMNRIQVYGHRGLGLLLLDVDHFKQFNDQYGHQVGDLVLQKLAEELVDQVRNVDLVARYGGEEFVVVLLEIDRKQVLEVAGRLREAVDALKIPVETSSGTKKLSVSVSIGAACYPTDADDKTELIHMADKAMYKAKELGRNNVVVAKPKQKGKQSSDSSVDRRS